MTLRSATFAGSQPGYRCALVVYCVMFMVLTAPYWAGNEVIAPHRQYLEFGLSEGAGDRAHIENRKFSDFTDFFIPLLTVQFKGPRSGWLTLWTNQNELGMPLAQLGGFSPAYPPSWLLSRFTQDPWRFITVLSLATTFLTGIFFFLFARESELSPLAALVAGASLAFSPMLMYWLTFPMFIAVTCWCSCVLWSVTRLAKRLDLLSWAALAFSIYSLLMTGYPQAIIIQSYVLVGYGLYLAWSKLRMRAVLALRFAAAALSAVIVGGLLALPVYIDVAHLAADSARVAPDVSFFLAAVPKVTNARQALQFIVLSTMPQLYGNPIRQPYPFPYDGLSFTRIVLVFIVIAIGTRLRQTWGWWLSVLVFAAITFIHPLFAVCVKYFGLNLSRCSPLSGVMLPLMVVVAYGADALVKRQRATAVSRGVLVALAAVSVLLALGCWFAFDQQVAVRWGALVALLAMCGCLAAQIRITRPALLVAALSVAALTISFPLLLRQDERCIARVSPLVEELREVTPPGSRVAIASPGLPVLPPNLNAELDLPSVHAYDSLSPRRYHELVHQLGGDVLTYGRQNRSIAPDYDNASFWMSNVGAVLSPQALHHANLVFAGKVGGVFLYRVVSRMGESVQIPLGSLTANHQELQLGDPRAMNVKVARKTLDQGDRIEFQVAPGVPSLLLLSRKYYRDWRACVSTGNGWAPAATAAVNGIFEGVLLPADAEKVRLEFRPWAMYAWVAHAFWALLLALMMVRALSVRWAERSEAAT